MMSWRSLGWLLPVIGLAVGVSIGWNLPKIPAAYTPYMAVAVLAAIDSVFGGVRSTLEHRFDTTVFVSGFFTNAILAAGLAYLGDLIGTNLYYAALFAFGFRIFQNSGYIRRYLLKK